MYIVYEHKNKINNKRYIGVTSKKPEERWSKKERSYAGNNRFKNSILKYGWDNFEHNVLFEYEDKELAYAKEIELIAFYDTTNCNKGYNRHIGGNAGFKGQKHSLETRKKISEKVKLAFNNTNTREKLSKSILAAYEKDPTYRFRVARKSELKDTGIFKHSEETKEKISKSLKGTHHTPETKEKISKAMKNKKHKRPYSAETLRKISEKQKERWKREKEKKRIVIS